MENGDGKNGEGAFERRLRDARGRLNGREEDGKEAASDDGTTASSFGVAIRIGTELVAGLAVGVAIGYGLDRWLGFRGLFLAVFAVLGFGAGMANVWRVVNGPGMGLGPKESGGAQRGERIED